MKKSKILSAFLMSLCLALSVGFLASCNPTEGSGSDSGSGNGGGTGGEFTGLTFTSSSSASIDEKSFTLSLDMKADKTLTLTAECTGEASSGGGGGFPGGGFPGGDFPFSATEMTGTAAVPATPFAGAAADGTDSSEEETDYSQYNFTQSGTWSEETGYGYTFVLNGETIHVNYDVYASVHYFYYAPSTTIDGTEATASSAVKMQSDMDTSYQKKLASDYEIYEARTCEYHFYGGAESSGGNLNVTDIYLMPDGSAVDMTGRDSITYKTGTWEEAGGVFTVTFDTTVLTSETSTDGNGYRFEYSGGSSGGPFGGSSSYFVYSEKADGTFYTSADFAA